MSDTKEEWRGDLLRGVAAIAAWIDRSPRQTERLVESKRIPAFKHGRSICMRKSSYAAFVARIEREALDPELAVWTGVRQQEEVTA